jgi:hypothetical protein
MVYLGRFHYNNSCFYLVFLDFCKVHSFVWVTPGHPGRIAERFYTNVIDMNLACKNVIDMNLAWTYTI